MSFFFKDDDTEDPSNYGDDSFTEAKVEQSGLLEDLKALGPDIGKDAMTLIEKVMSKGKPYDDKTFLVGPCSSTFDEVLRVGVS